MDNEPVGLSHPARGQPSRERSLRLDRKTAFWLLIALLVVGSLGAASIFTVRALTTPLSEYQVSSSVELAEAEREQQVGAETVPTAEALSAHQSVIPSKLRYDPRISFLLLGYGGGGHDGAFLTDSMIVAIADPAQKTLTFLSVPRDSWVPLLFDGKTAVYNRLNTAYAFARDVKLYPKRLARYAGSNGGGHFAMDTLSRPLGMPISNYLGLDFAGFRQMVDAVGGIDVRIPESFAARYPANDDPSIDPSWTVVNFRKGVEHMNGERAIRFARAREALDNVSEGSDFARSRRQRIVMEAFKTRLFEPGGLIHLPQLISIAVRHVDTDYQITAVTQLSQLILDWKDVKIYQTALSTANYLSEATGPEGAYILVPSAPDHSWAQIRAFAHRLWQDPATGVAMAETKIVVENDTGEPGLAMLVSSALMKLGYRVGPPVPGPERAQSRLIDRRAGKAKLVVAQLESDLGVDFQEVPDAAGVDAGELILQLGASDKYLAFLSVPVDAASPVSTAGVQNFDGWFPVVTSSPPEEPGEAVPEATPTGHVSPKPTGQYTSTVVPAGTMAARLTPTTPRPQASQSPAGAGTPPATRTVAGPTATATSKPVPVPRPSPTATP